MGKSTEDKVNEADLAKLTSALNINQTNTSILDTNLDPLEQSIANVLTNEELQFITANSTENLNEWMGTNKNNKGLGLYNDDDCYDDEYGEELKSYEVQIA